MSAAAASCFLQRQSGIQEVLAEYTPHLPALYTMLKLQDLRQYLRVHLTGERCFIGRILKPIWKSILSSLYHNGPDCI